MEEEKVSLMGDDDFDNFHAPSPQALPAEIPANNSRSTSIVNHWLYATIILCCYGFFKEFKPSEPFLTPYLVDDKNFTKDEVNSQVYPYWPYSYLVAAFFTFLLTDLVRYKPVILLESCAYLVTRVLLVWGTSIAAMQWMQIAYGVATATEIAYFSYIYAAVSVVHFKQVTSYVRAIRLIGQSLAGILAQTIISTGIGNYIDLNYISFGSVSVACVFAVLLPNVWDSTCCHPSHPPPPHPENRRQSASQAMKQWLTKATVNRLRDFIKFYSQLSLLKWSIWWALAMCGVLQVGNYVQSLWKEVGGSHHHEWNGVVEAIATLCSAIAAFTLSFLKVNWSVWGELTIGVLSLLDSLVLLFASSATHLWGAYISHIVYRSTYSFLITIASAQLAVEVDHESYAMIFGFNTFLALILQTILTLVVADEHGLDLDIRKQFVVYGGYYFVLTLIFVGAGVYKLTIVGWWRAIKSFWIQDSCPAKQSRDVQVQNVIQDNDCSSIDDQTIDNT